MMGRWVMTVAIGAFFVGLGWAMAPTEGTANAPRGDETAARDPKVGPLPAKEKIDAYLSKEFAALGPPGMAVAIVQNGQVAYARGFGYANIATSAPITPSTVFRIGSLTKQFTATVIMQLVHEGKLKLNSRLGDLLPRAPSAWSAVTISQLLSHTAGIPSYTAAPNFDHLIQTDVTVDHINDGVRDKPLDFRPGNGWAYSNSGYILLGQIIEKVTGEPYAQVLKQRIFDPLGMKDTFVASGDDSKTRRAGGYTRDSGGITPAPEMNMTWPFAAGSIESTVLDLAKWDAGLYGEKILSQAELQQMWRPTRLANGAIQNYGYGWIIHPMGDVVTYSHGGGINGFTSSIIRAPSIGLTVVVLTNWDVKGPDVLALRLMSFLDPRLEASRAAGIKDDNPEVTALCKKALESALAGKPDPSAFSPSMMSFLTPQILASVGDMAKQMGPIKGMTLTKSATTPHGLAREYRVTFQNGSATGRFLIGKSGLVESAMIN